MLFSLLTSAVSFSITLKWRQEKRGAPVILSDAMRAVTGDAALFGIRDIGMGHSESTQVPDVADIIGLPPRRVARRFGFPSPSISLQHELQHK